MRSSPLPLGQVKAESWLRDQLLLQAEQVTKLFEKLSPDRRSEGDDRSGWGSFSEDIYADIHLALEKGTHTLRIEKTEDDVGFAEPDAIDRIPCSLTGGVPEQNAET